MRRNINGARLLVNFGIDKEQKFMYTPDPNDEATFRGPRQVTDSRPGNLRVRADSDEISGSELDWSD
jgi:hypothetical protein